VTKEKPWLVHHPIEEHDWGLFYLHAGWLLAEVSYVLDKSKYFKKHPNYQRLERFRTELISIYQWMKTDDLHPDNPDYVKPNP